jgi:hypothetical protein
MTGNRRRYYINALKWVGPVILLMIVIGLVFPTLTSGASQETQESVLYQAIPFVAYFWAILLTYILTIALLAIRFTGRMPVRTHRPMERVLMIGILAGIVSLFQAFAFPPFQYGFPIVLASLLGYILWTHIAPAGKNVPAPSPFTRTHQIVALIVAGAVLVVFAYGAISTNMPQSPFGYRERQWNSFTDERRAEITEQMTAEFRNVEVPYLIAINLLPAALVFFVVREVAHSATTRKERRASPASPGITPDPSGA